MNLQNGLRKHNYAIPHEVLALIRRVWQIGYSVTVRLFVC